MYLYVYIQTCIYEQRAGQVAPMEEGGDARDVWGILDDIEEEGQQVHPQPSTPNRERKSSHRRLDHPLLLIAYPQYSLVSVCGSGVFFLSRFGVWEGGDVCDVWGILDGIEEEGLRLHPQP